MDSVSLNDLIFFYFNKIENLIFMNESNIFLEYFILIDGLMRIKFNFG